MVFKRRCYESLSPRITYVMSMAMRAVTLWHTRGRRSFTVRWKYRAVTCGLHTHYLLATLFHHGYEPYGHHRKLSIDYYWWLSFIFIVLLLSAFVYIRIVQYEYLIKILLLFGWYCICFIGVTLNYNVSAIIICNTISFSCLCLLISKNL